ncbi:unnamed protein product [Adineta ricciae]|uniref:Ubiquitin carboxyl-terminal hydrolase n=1 Tax=Adineta ricciae TaxID=249248 RepID=A0A815N8Z6_ADIRI|nr:unnamed protein product [Adineta ricciae]CAF1433907.1 unnamed protein product [Adineta ricciae]
MSRQKTSPGIPLPPSSTYSSKYSTPARSVPLGTTTNVAAIARSINNMSISAGTSRTPSSTERPLRSTRITSLRTGSSSQDRSNVQTNGITHDHTEQTMNPTATVYSISSNNESSISKISSTATAVPKTTTNSQSNLMNGGLCGLQNLGNTCFMNSVLQCLSNTKPLLLYCLEENLDDQLNTSTTSVMKGVLMKEYASLIRKMWLSSDKRSIVSPSSFKNTIGKFAPRFTGYSEQDSQEFLRYLLQGLSEDVNRVRIKPAAITVDEKQEERMREIDRAKASWQRCLKYENSRLVDIFAGQLKSTLECSFCQYQSITFDMFWDLSIPLPRDKSSTSLQECFQLFMNKEELDGDEKPMCAKCKQKRRCTKQLSIQKCPEILVLHLKRFSQSFGRGKLNNLVKFPIENLRLNEFISESAEGPPPIYNLFGISNHSGSLYTGHYVAECKHPFTHEWHEFNDSNVHTINDEESIISSNAYVLFYERQ